ncbi:hypothetical protein LJC72_10585, partial [Bacteroides sp. OttesenSCG-928-D19]|nr:hypothetical protein [Bacteroides sp. OttesenSCG-928-D19]
VVFLSDADYTNDADSKCTDKNKMEEYEQSALYSSVWLDIELQLKIFVIKHLFYSLEISSFIRDFLYICDFQY